MAVVAWDGSASTDFAADANWDTGSAPDGTSDVVIPDTSSINNPTLGADITINSLTVSANATIVGNASYTITCDGEADGTGATTSGYAVHMAGNGTIGTDLNITVTTAASTLVSLVPASGTVKNFTYNASGQQCSGVGATTINGDLTITAGTFQMYNDVALTVTGDVSVTGTLTGNASAISMGSLTIADGGTYTGTSGTTTITSEKTSSGYAWYNVSGTYTHNNGTVNFTSTADTHLRDDTFYNLTITGGASSSDFYYRPKDGGTGAVTIANDLTIVEGLFRPAGAAGALTVTGDVSIESGGVLGQDDSSGAMTFGSLTIESGGTYIATSGTTTFATADTHRAGYGGQPSALEVKSGGTFTHNKGTVKLTSTYDQDIEMDGTGTLYNLTFNKSDNDVIHTSSLVIENNLDVTLAAGHSLRPSSGSNTVTVYGNTYLTTGNIGDTTQYTGTNNWGLVTINSGEFILSTGTNNVSGIRNVGGTVSQS